MGSYWDSLPDHDSVTVLTTEAPVLSADGFSIVVLSPTFVATYTLPDGGEVTIGRSNNAEIYVDDPLVSRRHAIIVAGARPAIRDLGSSNGTLVGGTRIEANVDRPLAIGDVVLVGGAALLVQRKTTAVHPRKFWTRDEFTARLVDECARAARSQREFSVVVLELGHHVSNMITRQLLTTALRTSDVVGMTPSGYLLLLDVTGEQAAVVMQRISDQLAERDIAGRWGIAQYPKHGTTGEALVEHARPARTAEQVGSTNAIIRDPRMQELFQTADRIAAGDIGVLIVGETGAGKEVMAEEIHRRSKRANQPFLRINCGALSESLLESELFGHERGAFTSAVAAKPGLFEAADHGTVLLDEIGEMPMALQVKLLRVLEEQQVRRVGGVKSRPLDVRFIAATNRDLEQSIARGEFRQDLYYRLAGATLVVPPLRDRPGDLAPLVQAFLLRASRHLDRPPTVSDEAMARLRAHRWPGNIRELRHVIERAVLLAGSGTITLAHLPRPADPVQEPAVAPRASSHDLERSQLEAVLAACGGNQSRAAKQLGMSRGALIRRLELYGIVRPRKPD